MPTTPTLLTVPLALRPPYVLGPMPADRHMRTVDERFVRADAPTIFALVADVARWPEHLAHYRSVRFDERAADGGGLVEMAANRPFGPVPWPTWWRSEMRIDSVTPAVRFRHIGGVTTGMDVEWTFAEARGGTRVRIVHVWNGPSWLPDTFTGLRGVAADFIGSVFVHDIASRTLAGLARVAERSWGSRGGSAG